MYPTICLALTRSVFKFQASALIVAEKSMKKNCPNIIANQRSHHLTRS